MSKTNAMRILDELGLKYDTREYEVDSEDLSAEYVSTRLDIPLGQVFKTLVVKGDSTGIMLVCIPGTAELNLKALADLSSNKKIAMAPVSELRNLTGYIRGGVSPIGTKKTYPLYVDESVSDHQLISISAGKRGYQILISVDNLSRAVEITGVCDLKK